MADTLRDLANGTIGEPYRSPGMRAVGTLADLLAAAGQRMDHVGVTMPGWSPIAPGKSLTLKDMLIGDLARVLEDTSYGMPPIKGGNYATGGIGTYGLKPDAMELANAVPLSALVEKAAVGAVKRATPYLGDMR